MSWATIVLGAEDHCARLDLDERGGWLMTPAVLAYRLGLSEGHCGLQIFTASIAILIVATGPTREVRA
jgi:hypothetical protein